jgi:hypothetical protein
MKPDRENYEVWFTDWLDGNLTREQAEQFLAFLEENPDIKEEAESISFTRLASSTDHFIKKEDLKRSPSELALSQIEYLSVAYLEKDISAGQLADLKQNIDLNEVNKKLFESVQKIRLIPADQHFSHKNIFRKLSAGERIFRFSAIGLSAAAAIVLIILSVTFVPRLLPGTNHGTALNTAPDTSFKEFIIKEEKAYIVQPREAAVSGKANARKNEVQAMPSEKTDNQPKALAEAVSTSFERSFPVIKIAQITEGPLKILITGTPEDILMASNNRFAEPAYNEERNRLGRFIARTFRGKILKEAFPRDSPLKSYEIAEAGIEGLNKLLGWKMALVKTNDEQGELKSIYFSSRVLKFNAPVKKAESAQ